MPPSATHPLRLLIPRRQIRSPIAPAMFSQVMLGSEGWLAPAEVFPTMRPEASVKLSYRRRSCHYWRIALW